MGRHYPALNYYLLHKDDVAPPVFSSVIVKAKFLQVPPYSCAQEIMVIKCAYITILV